MTIVSTPFVPSNSYAQKSALKSAKINDTATSNRNGHINGTWTHPSVTNVTTTNAPAPLLAKFVDGYKELASYKYVQRYTQKEAKLTIFGRNGKAVTIDGHTLSIAAITAAARFNGQVELTGSLVTRQNVQKTRTVIDAKVASGTSIYGVSTGFGGSGNRYFTSTVYFMRLIGYFSQRTHAQAMTSRWDMRCYNTSTSVCCHHPSLHPMLYLFLIPLPRQVCRSHGCEVL
jgi:phenylalanine ammonia-lyase